MRLTRILLALLILFSFTACTEEPSLQKKFRIGIIQFTNTNDKTRAGFIDGLASRGYIDGKNIEYLYFGNAYSFEEINGLLDRILEMHPDLIYASTTPATIRAYQKTKNLGIPVVFGPVNDPVKAGIIRDIRAPGENITGIRLAASDQKRLEWLKFIDAKVETVLIPYNRIDPSSNITVNLVTSVAADMGIRIITRPVDTKDDVFNIIENLPDDIQAVFLPRDGLVMSAINEFAAVCVEKKLILSTPRYEQVKAGATTGYGFIGQEVGKQAARMADVILKGTPPGMIPVETAEDYLFINTEIANAIDLKISDMILRQIYK